LRDTVTVIPSQITERLAATTEAHDGCEALLLCTCNRSELYMAAANGNGLPAGAEVFAQLHRLSIEDVAPHLYQRHGLDAVRHLCSVAAGVDSMVLGESEIMGQIKEALALARGAGSARGVLVRMVDCALAAGKRARTETAIDRGAMSVASVAVVLVQNVFGDLSKARVLVLGAGETGELVTARLHEAGARGIIVSNRSFDRALALAERFGGEAVRFDGFPTELAQADIVIASTSAPHPMITVPQVAAALGDRRKPMFFIDLAVPRNIEPEVRSIRNVHLYDLDTLQDFVADTEAERRSEVPKVRAIIEEEARQFLLWAKSERIVPMTLEILDRAEAVRAAEAAKADDVLATLTPKQERAVNLLTKRVVHRILRDPLERLRELACTDEGVRSIEAIEELFGLGQDPFTARPPAGPDSREGGPF
jgi:glutamyl-tRNA reductase